MAALVICSIFSGAGGLQSVHSQAELNSIYDDYDGRYSSSSGSGFSNIFLWPLAVIYNVVSNLNSVSRVTPIYDDDYYFEDDMPTSSTKSNKNIDWVAGSSIGASSEADSGGLTSSNLFGSSGSKDYSTTNIQVENVDEADITKTDGDYIYSLSEDKVVITDARNPENLRVAAEIGVVDGYPIDLMLSDNGKLIVIAENLAGAGVTPLQGSSSSGRDTIVNIYDITDRTNPTQVKTFRLYEEYYTSRRIGDKLYIISSGALRKSGDDVVRGYREDGQNKDIEFSNIKYLKEIDSPDQTLLAQINLSNLGNVNVSSYLVNIDNAYISEGNIYLANETDSEQMEKVNWGSIFGWRGLFGLILPVADSMDYNYNSETMTDVYKFEITDDRGLKYVDKAETVGTAVNQFSFDEYDGNLRMATKSNEGSRVVVFDQNMTEIGASEFLAKGEQMYSSRFMGERAYLVTYLVTDPLYVIDVSNPRAPQALGELKIPGYSTYLHPYDDTHLIGIGMNSTETTRRTSDGRVSSVSSRITGMKMALFDVSNVTNPKQLSQALIGDSRTSSAILTNHKALLFSKEKQFIAIPVNNYQDDFSVEESNNIETSINQYKKYGVPYTSEGYFVYNVNLTDGFSLKGAITHDKASDDKNRPCSYSTIGCSSVTGNTTRLLRGLYINDDLFTVSEDEVMVNKLSDLSLVSKLNLIKE